MDDFTNCGSGSILNFGANNFNASTWINTSDVSATDWMGVLSKYVSGTGLWIQLSPTVRYVGFGWDGSVFVTSSTSVNNGVWRNISCQRTGSTTAEIYVDGAIVASGAGPVKGSDSAQQLDVGRIDIAGRYFNGKISGTQIYNRALTAIEVAQNFNALRGRYGI